MKEFPFLQNVVKQKALNEIFQWHDTVFSKLPTVVSLRIILFIYLFIYLVSYLFSFSLPNTSYKDKVGKGKGNGWGNTAAKTKWSPGT